MAVVAYRGIIIDRIGVDPMPTVAATLAAIKALPGMTARRTDGEWRVTYTAAAITEREGVLGRQRDERAESLACYTNDAGDAFDTAGAMSRAWYGDRTPVMVNPEIVSAPDALELADEVIVDADACEALALLVYPAGVVYFPGDGEALRSWINDSDDTPAPTLWSRPSLDVPFTVTALPETKADAETFAAPDNASKADRLRGAVDQLAGELAGEGNASAAELLRDAGRSLNTLCDREAARLADVIAEHPTKAAALAALEAAAAPVPDSERHATRTDSEGRQFIDMTPTWEEILGTLLAVYSDGDSEGRKFARGELTRMARLADRYTSAAKALQS